MKGTSGCEWAWRHAVAFLLILGGALISSGCVPSETTESPVQSDTDSPVQTVTEPLDRDATVAKYIEVEIDDTQVRWDAHLRRLRQDRIRWHNSGSEQITIQFVDAWPFAEAEAPIAVPAGGHSDWYTVQEGASGLKRYRTSPPRSGWAPEGPQVSVGD